VRISTIIIIILLIAASIILVFHMEKMGFFDVKCNVEDQVQIVGILQGFASNSSYRDYTDVRVDGLNYTFYTFDKEMVLYFVGQTVEINCCYRQNTTRSIENYYNLISIYLTGE